MVFGWSVSLLYASNIAVQRQNNHEGDLGLLVSILVDESEADKQLQKL
jgi:hypothetical protein